MHQTGPSSSWDTQGPAPQGAAISWEQPVGALGGHARSRFVARAYSHFFGALLAFGMTLTLLFQSGMAAKIAAPMMEHWLVVLGGFLVVGWIGRGVAHSARSAAAQYLALFAYVIVEALIFCPLLFVAKEYYPGVIGAAAVVTLVGFSGLTALVFTTRKNFSVFGGLLKWGGMMALLLIVGSITFGFNLGMAFTVGMIFLAGLSVLYDTSKILESYPEDRYVGAALELFASIALMFWFVVRLFMDLEG